MSKPESLGFSSARLTRIDRFLKEHYVETGKLTGTLLAAWLIVGTANAAVTISSQSTLNMSCSDGVCAPTADDAVLNAGDLEAMLTLGNAAVTTTGSGGIQADDVKLATVLGWSSSATLELDAHRSLAIDQSVSVEGAGGLSLVTDDGGSGGTLSFSNKGRVSFTNLSSALSINGTAFTLLGTVPSLASAIAANPSGFYALAADYDAGVDGTYASAPIPTFFTGTLEGLGNTISNLRIKDPTQGTKVGLFAEIGGTVSDLELADVDLHTAGGTAAGGLVGVNIGTLHHDSVSGFVSVGGRSGAGGLVGDNSGLVVDSSSSASVSGRSKKEAVGGLAGGSSINIDSSFATGPVTAGRRSYAGGLVGIVDMGIITNSYATGSVSARGQSLVGGFVGEFAESGADTSYSTGRVKGGDGSAVGGFAGSGGESGAGCTNRHCYWDTTTSGVDNGVGVGEHAGITGLTTEQFQLGLPNGFDPAIWNEKSNIADGFPYLIANPPKKK